MAVCLGLAWLSVVRVAPAAEGPSGGDEPLIYPMVFPLLGDHTLTDSFGDPRGGGRSHAGIDIMAERMVPVVAVADGTVRWIHNERGDDCCDVALLHDDGWRSRYIHLNNDTPGTDDGRAVGIAPGVTKGARVIAGQVIGWVGDSGNAESTAPHLHFELRRPDGRPVDALPSLRAARLRARELGSSRREGRVVAGESGAASPEGGTGETGVGEGVVEEGEESARRGFWRRLLRDPDEGIPPAPPMPEDEGEPTRPVEEEEAVQVPRPPLAEEVAVAEYPDDAYPDLGMERRVERLEWDGAEMAGEAVSEPSGGGGGERPGTLGCFGFAGDDDG